MSLGSKTSRTRLSGGTRRNSVVWPYNVSYPEKLGVAGVAVVFVCYLTSSFFSAVFLLVLTVCALVSACFRRRDRAAVSRVTLSEREKKLKLDLRYYVQLEGLELIENIVSTDDGFRIILHRIIDPSEADEARKKRYPVLLQHGLMQSSAAYCTSGHESLGLYLFRAGYDVWLGNNRCGFHPRHRLHSYLSVRMWQWGIGELGTKDVPAMVDFVQKATNAPKVALVAHSQGTTQTFYALSRDCEPEIGLNLSSFSALAPAVYTGPLLDRWFFRFVRCLPQGAYHFFFGHHSFIGLMAKFHRLVPERVYAFFGYLMFNYLLNWDDRLWNPVYRDRQFLFSPTYVSAELMYWWLGRNGFANNGCIFNEGAGQWFDNQMFPPLAIFAPGRDDLVDPNALVTRLSSYEQFKVFRIFDLPTYSHLDVLWATDVVDKVGKPLNEFIWENVDDKHNWSQPLLDV
jgi:pimeloyl-ACP methyl ester carboxylesterase